MKNLIVLSFLCLVSVTSAQSINQFDAGGKRHGIWKKTFDNTNVLRYEGEFFHGKEIGVFKFYKNIDNKASLTATKKFNKENNKAYVVFYTSTKKVISEGEMEGKRYVGIWKYYQKTSSQLLTLENYSELGELDGDRFVYYENGQIAEKKHYAKGKLEGPSFWYSDKNVVLKEFHYLDGELHGPSKIYGTKGQLIIEGSYKQGKKHGIWKYYENGKLIEEKDFTYKPKYIKKQ